MKRIEKWLTFCFLAVVLALNISAEAPPELSGLSVSVEDYTYGSQRSEPVVAGNIENGKESYFVRRIEGENAGPWTEITERPTERGMPTEGGRYELSVKVDATANYSGGSAGCFFSVLPTNLDIGLSIKDSLSFGEPCIEGVLFEVTDLLGREYSLSFAPKGSGAFVGEAPTKVGSYTMRISVRGSANYNATEKTADFEIVKRRLDGELRLDDITLIYGSGSASEILPDYIGGREAVAAELIKISPIVEYRPWGSAGAFSKTAPSVVGEYDVRVSYPESENLAAVSVSAILKIIKSPISPTVSMEGWVYGETPSSPMLSEGANPGNGGVVYYYKLRSEDRYSTVFPVDAGEYTVKAVISETESFAGGECYADFTVEKSDRSGARLVFGDYRYGDRAPTPFVSGTSDGAAVSFSYARRGSDDYSEAPPTEAGEYTLKAAVEEGKNYKKCVLTFDFVVEKADIFISVYRDSWTYGESAGAFGISGNDGDSDYELEYYAKTQSGYRPLTDGELVDGVPYLAGEYKMVCRVKEGKNHKGAEAYAEFTVNRAAPGVSVSMPDFAFYGKIPSPTVSGNVENGEVSFIYYPKGGNASEGSYNISEVVTSPGEYTVTAVVAQTANYKMAQVSADFTVTKADLPISSMSLSLKVGGEERDRVKYGEEYELLLRNNVGYGSVTYAYQKDGGAFVPEKPRSVGKYKVKVSVAPTDVYKSLTLYFDIEIVRAERGELSLEVEDIRYGEEIKAPVLTGNTEELNDSRKVYAYKPYGSDDSSYTDLPPEEVGKYTVKLTVLETESYLGTELTAHFEIKKAESVITASDLQVVYSGKTESITATLNHSEAELVYEGNGAVDAGEYTVRISVPESKSYSGASVTVKLTVVRAQGSIVDVGMSDREYNGESVSPPSYKVIGDGAVTVEYYQNGEVLSEAPIEIGDYTVKIILSDGKNYKGGYAEADFSIFAPIAPETSENGGSGEEKKKGSGIVTAVVIAAIILAAIGVALFVMMKKNKNDRDGGPDSPRPDGPALPPSDAEGADRLEAPEDPERLSDGRHDASNEERDDTQTEEGPERMEGGGRIALDMWLEPNETGADEAFEVVYKKGGRCAEINMDTLCRHFDDGEVVDMESLIKKGLINSECKRVKLLGRGAMTKDLDIRLNNLSKKVKDAIKQKK